jgi:hypothetical protein
MQDSKYWHKAEGDAKWLSEHFWSERDFYFHLAKFWRQSRPGFTPSEDGYEKILKKLSCSGLKPPRSKTGQPIYRSNGERIQ